MDNQFGTGFQKARPELVYLGGDNVDNFAKMFQLQMMLFLLMAVGVIFRKRNIISESGRKTLPNLTVNLILPCNIIESFLGEWNVSENLLRHCLVALGISLGIQVAALYLSMLFFAPVSRDKKNIFKYGLIVSNSSFIGIPVVGELYGNLGVLYTSFFQIPIRIMMWTAGLSLFTNVDKKESFQKLIKHPCIIAIVIGAFLMIASVPLPSFLGDTIAGLSKCTTPLSMITVGAMFANSKWSDFLDPSILYYCLIRLIVFPAIVFGAVRLLGIDLVLGNVAVLLSAMPMAATTAILADKYNYNGETASRSIFVSTLLSIVTLPVICLML